MNLRRLHHPYLLKNFERKRKKNIENLDLLEEDLTKKKKDVERVNQELFNAKTATSNLKNQFDNLQSEKEKGDEKLNLFEKDIQKKKEEIDKANQKQVDSEKEIVELRSQFDNLKLEKFKVENERITPEKHKELLQELQNQKDLVKNFQVQLNSLQSEKITMENE